MVAVSRSHGLVLVALFAAGLIALLVGCAVPHQEERVSPSADVEAYERELHLVLEVSCATLDCHGVPGRPLRLYSETGLRLRDELRDQPMTAEELMLNVQSLFGVHPEAPRVDDHDSLTKPLSVSAGGLRHEGGDVWPTREDPAYRCLAGWMGGDAPTEACDTAREALPVELTDP